MNLRVLTGSIIVSLPCLLFAKGNISGKVFNKSTGEPMDFVTVQLLDAKGKPLAIGTATDLDGSFVLQNVNDGNYIVKFSNIGSVEQERPVQVSGANIVLDDVRLADDAKVLQEVVVEGIKSQMRFELDKKVFQVDANLTVAGTSASELLESIPSVEVDQDGEVSLRGNSSVTIWINGKESGLTADNRAQILEQIPAETIDRVEVITNPSAKYSPEGTAGIINIILKKDRRAGYFGSAEISGNSRGGGNVGFNINYNHSKVDAFAGVGFRMRRNKGGSLMDRTYDKGYEFAPGQFYDEEYYTNSNGQSPSQGNNVFLRLGASYHITDFDDISLSGFGMIGHNKSRSITDYTSNLPENWISNLNTSRRKGDMRGTHVELGYTHKWTDTNILDINGSFNYWGGPNNNSYFQEQVYDYPYPDYTYYDPADDLYYNDVYQEQSMNMGMKSWEVKVDYTNQLSKWLKLETGYKGNFAKENSPTDTYTGTSKEDLKQNELLYNRFIYRNDINAVYATLGGTVKSFSFSAGLRGEQWTVHTKSLGFGQKEEDTKWYKKNNFALFPSLFLSLSLPYENELQVNYTRRLRRPWGGQLNSFHDISDPANISYGNPELQPQYSNSYELNYLKSWTWHMISLSAYLRTTSNMTNRVSFLDGDVMYSTWANVADETNSGCEIVVKNNFFRVLDLTTTVNLYNNHISAWKYNFEAESGNIIPLSGDKQDSFAWSIRAMAGVKLPWTLSFQANGGYNSRMLTAQGSREGGWSVDVGLRKNLGNWSFSVNCRDLFDSRRFKSTTNGPGYSQYSERWRGGRTVRLTVKFSFGNMGNKKGNRDEGEPMDGSGYGSDMDM
ncbi:MAG: TonB-dependent receptor [Muribaculaceae bacterium]|nr:TonB-dependent receptor [Muribaculaceae bacterium]